MRGNARKIGMYRHGIHNSDFLHKISETAGDLGSLEHFNIFRR